jgi:molybdate transport system substrate-binding protein
VEKAVLDAQALPMHVRRRPVLLTVALAVATLLVLAVVAVAVLAPGRSADGITVYAAASLRGALPRIDGEARFSFAGSNQLQLQIERGAPADLFVSASPDEAQALFRAGRCTRPVTIATNRLVLLVPRAGGARVQSVAGLRQGGLRLAIGTPGVPVGDYTREVLSRLGLRAVLTRNRVSLETNVSGVVSKVALASADAGFAYATDGLTARRRVKAIALPRRAQPPVRYQACVVRRRGGDGAGGNAFLRRLRATPGRRVLEAGGFGLPPRG